MEDLRTTGLELCAARAADRCCHYDIPTAPKFSLQLAGWITRDVDRYSLKDHAEAVTLVLGEFLNMARANGLGNSPAAAILQQAQATVQQGETAIAIMDQETRIARTSTAAVWQSRDDLIDRVPLFNMWDALSFVYSFCVESIETQLQAELHLFQFRTILSVLRRGPCYDARYSPTTVAATWSDSFSVIAFATSCVGDPRNRARMAAKRVDFIKDTFGVMSFLFTTGLIVVPPNRVGNCPEMIVWGIVCRRPGGYNSLCINVPVGWNVLNKSLRYCGYCNQLANLLDAMQIRITDRWDRTMLRNPAREPVMENEHYPYQELLTNGDILRLSP
jgi:hypothetical protein